MSLIHLLCWLLSAQLSLQEIINIAKPGCPTKCGNLTIPYPFGIRPNCSMNPWFDIFCNTSVDPPYALVSGRDDYRLIDMTESQVRIKNPFFARRCDDNGANGNSNFTLDFSGTLYTLSVLNTLTHIGCSDLAVLEGLSLYDFVNKFAGGCVSFCFDSNKSRGSYI
ncbi:hypothetical protein CDL12_06358 [Handroanthus impetiginosus]|uniref:Wall-associated receptor kinase galacturonan-binding domain-containing protein n=1 Tax=Handroanthus impetiginosus TaxID=429701 RepID=A0A2G9HU28_9LAMI|nr:hypothetical protein CDL12_06358 [Handroanthus impetiginosus]